MYAHAGAHVRDDGAVRALEGAAGGRGEEGGQRTSRTFSFTHCVLLDLRRARVQARREERTRATHGVPLASRCRLSRAMTWPHGKSMGGFCAVLCSFETGHAKIEWNR